MKDDGRTNKWKLLIKKEKEKRKKKQHYDMPFEKKLTS